LLPLLLLLLPAASAARSADAAVGAAAVTAVAAAAAAVAAWCDIGCVDVGIGLATVFGAWTFHCQCFEKAVNDCQSAGAHLRKFWMF
jgi:hypothetical protein